MRTCKSQCIPCFFFLWVFLLRTFAKWTEYNVVLIRSTYVLLGRQEKLGLMYHLGSSTILFDLSHRLGIWLFIGEDRCSCFMT